MKFSAHFEAGGIEWDYGKLVDYKPVTTIPRYYANFCQIFDSVSNSKGKD
ncbi:MAG: hypothetical protein HXX20_22575 [Chloroflexi bacterium]|nr:hypothetical protein [Chloroflexota bacterium]